MRLCIAVCAALLALLSATGSVFAQAAKHVVISQIAPMGGNSTQFNTGEFIELYNPLPADVTFGPNVEIVSGNTSGTNAAEWQLSLSGKTIRGFGFFLIGDGGVAVACDASFLASRNLSNSKSRSCVQLMEGSAIIDAFGWDPTGTTLSPEGTAYLPSGTSVDGKSFQRKSGPTSLSDDNLGNAWDTDDNSKDFFEHTASQTVAHNSSSPKEINPYSKSGSGIGSAQISPVMVSAGTAAAFTISLTGNDPDTISTIVVVIPAGFTWAMNNTSVSLSGKGLSATACAVSEDTVFITGAAVTGSDTALIGLRSITAPDSVLHAGFILETAVAGVEPSAIQDNLLVSVTKYAPVISVHVNDSNGVPAEPYQVDALVRIGGIITADLDPARTDICVQDETAGIEVYSSTRFADYKVGDSVTVTGKISQFAGLTEINPDSIFIHSSNNPVPSPMVLTAAEINRTFETDEFTEPNEGRLVRINRVTFVSSSANGGTITDETGTAVIYSKNIYSYPTGTFDIVGIVKQHKTSPPFTSGYEIDPRSQGDIIVNSGSSFVVQPIEKNILRNSVTICFTTSAPSHGVVKYGLTAEYTDSVVVPGGDTTHSVILSGLWPATVYHYRVGASDETGTNYSRDAIFSTASPEESSDSMNVYFNYPTDSTVSLGENATTADLSQRFLYRINAAKYSIDVALYSLSGAVGSNVTAALLSAKDRGVKVRVIVESTNSGSSAMNALKSSVPFITDAFDQLNGGAGLMHNKFAIFDFHDTTSAGDDWVWTGSWNATDPGTNGDAQNAIEIQDKALANAYTMEFNEMWGSSTDTPDASASRFGARKTDNTPHRFVIGGFPVELYFSPSDRTTMHIGEELNSAIRSISISMLTFTRDDLAQIIIAKKAAGKKVRVVLDDNTDIGNEFNSLASAGVDVHLKGRAVTGYLHHKYAIIDGEMPSADQAVITGSHNWSSAAETSNNENTLIIHSGRIANLYLQEFKARYIEAGGSEDIILGIERAGEGTPETFRLNQNYPNPFNPSTIISYQLPMNSHVTLKVYDVLGREVRTLVNGRQAAGDHSVTFDVSNLPSGVYFYRIVAGNFVDTKKLMVVK